MDSDTHLLNNCGQSNYLYEIFVMGNLLLNDIIKESHPLEAWPSRPTIAVEFSELIVRFNLQFSVSDGTTYRYGFRAI